MKVTKESKFLRSALTLENLFVSTREAEAWLKARNAAITVNVEKIKLEELAPHWHFQEGTGNIVHQTGKFFSIEGIQVNTNWGNVPCWSQPIINQPEIGFLGIITKEIDNVLYFLMQAKIEPGNINHVQLSPTLQATRSNYTQAHKGKKPLYLEYFQDRTKSTVLLDQLQSEQGARFLKKRNRNIIIQVYEDIEVKEDFIWLTLGQINQLIKKDNVVNMDTRTVISGIPFGNYKSDVIDFYTSTALSEGSGRGRRAKGMMKSMLDEESALNNFEDIISWLTELKSKYDLEVERIPLNKVDGWVKSDMKIHHKDHKYFNVIGVNVTIDNREVKSWKQPLVEPAQHGLCATICKEINGNFHFLVQAKLESGNFDILELAPTVQCLTGNYRNTGSENLPFLEYVLSAKDAQIVSDTLQSEEGGRFYREQNRNLIIEANGNFPEQLPPNYMWMTLHQLKTFIRFNNYLNIQSRSLLSAISFI